MRTLTKSSCHNEGLSRLESEVDRRILIVHDHDRERNEIADYLSNDYFCTTAASIQEALAHLAIDEYALIILNPQMVLFDEEYFHDYFRNLYPDISIIFLGHSCVNLNTEELVHIQLPFDQETLDQVVSRILSFRQAVTQLRDCRLSNEQLIKEKEHLDQQLHTMKFGFVQTVAQLLKEKDEAAYSRSLLAGTYVELLSEAYSLNKELRESLGAAVVLRELKEGSSIDFLNGVDSFLYVVDILRFEQENCDGTGRPMALEGNEIPIASRILRVAVEFASRDEEEIVGLSSNVELDSEMVECLTRLIKSDNRLGGVDFTAISNPEPVRSVALTIQNN